MTTETPLGGTQRMHPDTDRCFYCASYHDLYGDGPDSGVVHMDTTEDQCPFSAPDDEEGPA